MADLSVVGKSVARVDALKKVTGTADYTVTFSLPRMLYGKVIRSPYPHAKILTIDTSRMEKLPGIKAVVTAMNTPPIPLGVGFCDRYLFPPDLTVRYVGDAVAAVAAESEDIAEEAAAMIKVQYEELPGIFDEDEAFRTNPPVVIHPQLDTYHLRAKQAGFPLMCDPERPNVCRHFKIRKGDVDEGFKEADLIVEDRYYTPKAQHCQLEPFVSVAWFEPDGTLRLKTATQGSWNTKRIICNAFNLPPSKVIIDCPYVGGAFGGKVWSVTDPYAVLLSMKTGGKPVKVGLTRAEHFHCGRSKIALVTYIKDGVKKDGTIVSRQLRSLVNTGAYATDTMILARNCAFGAVGLYNIANFKLDSYGVYTNTPISGAFRGFGSAEIIWAIENQMDVIAKKLGLDPLEVRRKNLLKEGERDVCGQLVKSFGVEKCLDKVQQWIEWGSQSLTEEGPWRRGKGIALANKYTQTGFLSSAWVKVHPDGSIEVRHSSSEVGMGIDTVAAQVAAESFGISVEDVKVVSGDTSVCPYGQVTASSRETFYMGNAVLKACDNAKRELFEIAALKLAVPVGLLGIRDKKVFVKEQPSKTIEVKDLFSPPGVGYAPQKCEITGKYTYEVPFIPEDPETGQSEKIAVSYSYGAEAVEVAVDTETGEVQILKRAGCFDCGTPINPQMCESQAEGAMAMSLGVALYEEQLMGEKGEVLNPNFHDYGIPTIEDMPHSADSAVMLAPAPHPDGPFGAKGAGEVPIIPGPPAISNAIFNAVGIRIKELPVTKEKVLKALKEKSNEIRHPQ